MGCPKLNIDFFHFLEIIHSKKKGCAEKKRINYYPFGLQHKGYNNVVTSTNPAQNYTYNGKEEQEELGLNWHDYGFRNYDASLGRFMNIDPLGELYTSISHYSYALNNPINNFDRFGMDVVNAHKEDLDNAKSELESAKTAQSNLGKNATRKEKRAARGKVASAKSKVGKQQKLFDTAQTQIDDLENNHNDFFKVLDNLTDAAGDKVDVSFGVQENFLLTTGLSGQTLAEIATTTDENGQTIAVVKTLEDGTQVFTIKGGKSGKVNQIDIIIDSKYATPGVASHEGGHAEYIARLITSYANWIWDRSAEGKNMTNHNGHNYNDPSGKNADKRTKEYKKLNPNK